MDQFLKDKAMELITGNEGNNDIQKECSMGIQKKRLIN